MEDNVGLTSGKSSGTKLGAGVLGGGERAQKEDAKQRFAKFFEGLEDLERLHMAYPLSRDDDELRESLKREVLRWVLAAEAREIHPLTYSSCACTTDWFSRSTANSSQSKWLLTFPATHPSIFVQRVKLKSASCVCTLEGVSFANVYAFSILPFCGIHDYTVHPLPLVPSWDPKVHHHHKEHRKQLEVYPCPDPPT